VCGGPRWGMVARLPGAAMDSTTNTSSTILMPFQPDA
jgi:hypothetical protein